MAGHIFNMPQNNPGASTANLRQWGAAIRAALTQVLGGSTPGSGNFVASDINWSTVTLPTSTGASIGYETWKLNDPTYAASPVYMKFTYTTGASFASYINICLNVGTGWSGGALTGPGSTTIFNLTTTSNNSSTKVGGFRDEASSNSWMNSDGDGFVWLHAVDSITQNGANYSKFLLVVDRQRNPNGVAQTNTGWPANLGYFVGKISATSENPTSFSPPSYGLTMVVDPISSEAITSIRWPIIARPGYATSLSGDGTKTLASPMWIVNRQGSYTSKMVLSIPRDDVNPGNVVNLNFLNASRDYKASAQYTNSFDYTFSAGNTVALWWGDV